MINFPKPIVTPIQMTPQKPMTLGELYDIASQYGEVQIGGLTSHAMVKIDCNFVGDDHVFIRSKKTNDVLKNLGEVIRRAEQLKQFYKGLD